MQPRERILALDAARAVAISLVVLAHGAVPYIRTDVGWAVYEPSSLLIGDAVGWVIRAFVMPLFFLLSGFWAAVTIQSTGLKSLVRQRLLRLVVPLVVFLVPISMAMNALWDWGKSLDANRVIQAGAVPELRASAYEVTLGHLWFLYYLILVTLVGVIVFAVGSRLGLSERARTLRIPLVAWGAASAWLPLWWSGKLQLDTALGFNVDVPIALFHGLFFAWGWLLFGRREELVSYSRHVWLLLAAAAACFAGLLPALLGSVSGESGATAVWSFAMSGLFSCATVAFSLGFCGRWLDEPSEKTRLVSSASYWTYIIHLPMLVLAQVALHQVPVPTALKYAASVSVVVVICLVSYRYLVQPTRLRHLLG